jgi:hypothetical protein
MNKCICENCDLEVFENSDKCILHCEKDDWNKYKETKEGREFWEKILSEKIKKDDYNFSYIIFPYFYFEKIEKKDNNFYTLDSFNFFEKDKEYVFEKDVNFNNAVFTSYINFNHLKFKENVTFNEAKFLNNIHLNNTIFEKEVSFSGATFEKSAIFNSLECKGVLNLEKVIIKEKFHLMRLKNQNLKVSFDDAEFYEKSRIEIFDSDVGILSLQGIFNSSEKIVFNRLTVNKEFRLHDMNLNNLEVLYLNVSNAKIDLFNVLFEKAIVSNINLGENIENRFTYYGDKENYFTRDIMRQFKHLFEQSGNIIEANKFYALEMKEREKELEENIKKGKNIFEWLVFKIHGISSNHSQDWVLSIFWILNISILIPFFQLICFETLKIEMTIFIITYFYLLTYLVVFSDKYRAITIIISSFLIYMVFYKLSPSINLNSMSSNLNPFSIMIESNGAENKDLDFITLIFKSTIAYLIYQLIISIRQNTRRK